jgi:hypothetical protein
MTSEVFVPTASQLPDAQKLRSVELFPEYLNNEDVWNLCTTMCTQMCSTEFQAAEFTGQAAGRPLCLLPCPLSPPSCATHRHQTARTCATLCHGWSTLYALTNTSVALAAVSTQVMPLNSSSSVVNKHIVRAPYI